jgi:hypothetical protein
MADSKKVEVKMSDDVAHPDKSSPDDTSRPIIVTNRPIIKDPMTVDQDAAQMLAKEPAKLKKQTAPDLKPLSAPTLPEDKPADLPEVPIETAIKAAASRRQKPADEEAKTHELEPEEKVEKKDEKPEIKKEAEKPKVEEPIPEKETKEPSKEMVVQPDEKPALEPAPAKPEVKPEAEPEPEPKPDTEEPEKTDEKTKKELTDKVAVAEAEEAKRTAEIQKLIESKKYVLPINSVEKRRTKRFMALGILLCLLLAAAWVDISLDAGLIHINGLKAVTHFFST